MTVNAVRRTRRRAAAPPEPEPPVVAPVQSLAIGEINQTVFDCPKCRRPLAMGSRRCPGCGTRLLIGVPAAKASVFIVGGLALGVLLGGAGGYVVAATNAARTPGQVAVGPSAAPIVGPTAGTLFSAAPIPSTTAPTPPGAAGMPPIARSSLTQAVAVNERLTSAAQSLVTDLAANPFDASAVAQTLRTISADSVYAEQLADRLATWPGSAAVAAELGTLYGSVHDLAAESLVASVRNEAAYRDAARSMVRLLGGIPAVDSRLRDLATANGVDLPSASSAP